MSQYKFVIPPEVARTLESLSSAAMAQLDLAGLSRKVSETVKLPPVAIPSFDLETAKIAERYSAEIAELLAPSQQMQIALSRMVRESGVSEFIDRASAHFAKSMLPLSEAAISLGVRTSFPGLEVDLPENAGTLVEADFESVVQILDVANSQPEALSEFFRPLDDIDRKILAGFLLAWFYMMSILFPELRVITEVVGNFQLILSILR